ncbi:hypothetical protein BDN72DRAFT_435270 [Pluteus cervinus]|uniref:Uncharacterized protein n=1 Tax=Pluteus cervinus TaxID=181527 RepID=A0ACD3A9X3_9AGAR|nr:hypothetical protein BDN72DRAFT_435270 [Pluteus cervinus]
MRLPLIFLIFPLRSISNKTPRQPTSLSIPASLSSSSLPIQQIPSNADLTSFSLISTTVQNLRNNTGPSIIDVSIPQNQVITIPKTAVTAINGVLTSSSSPPPDSDSSSSSTTTTTIAQLTDADKNEYDLVFNGTTTTPDAAINGIGYLTYTVLPDQPYNVQPCFDFCDRVEKCVFINTYREFNNNLTSPYTNLPSTLKCALFAQIHTSIEKTNFGGQQLLPNQSGGLGGVPNQSGGLTYIEDSRGYKKRIPPPLRIPRGYELVFGPTDRGINLAPGTIASYYLNFYDVQACANLCTKQGGHPQYGLCKFFNIALVSIDEIPTTYLCNIFGIPTNASTLRFPPLHTPQNVRYTSSLGMVRINLIKDGSFESYNACEQFCYTNRTAFWRDADKSSNTTSDTNTNTDIDDATIFHYKPYAYSGSSCALLGSATFSSGSPGLLTYLPAVMTLPSDDYGPNSSTSQNPDVSSTSQNLDVSSSSSPSTSQIIPNPNYILSFFANSAFSGPTAESGAYIEVLWNGIVPPLGGGRWELGYNKGGGTGETSAVYGGTGDRLAFRGSGAPKWVFIDEVYLFLDEVYEE